MQNAGIITSRNKYVCFSCLFSKLRCEFRIIYIAIVEYVQVEINAIEMRGFPCFNQNENTIFDFSHSH